MSGDPIRFLGSFAQALSAMTLYKEGHPAREKAVDAAFKELRDLQAVRSHALFTFLGDEIVFGRQPLREMKAWDWSRRLAQAGVQRLEFEDQVTREDFETFLDEVLARLTLSTIDTSEARPQRRTSIKFGAVGLKGEAEAAAREPIRTATLGYSLNDEAETLRWLQQEAKTTGIVPLVEAEAVVRSLSVAMHGDRQVMLPLLQLKEFDQYTTTHSMNVSVLTMGLAEFLGFGPTDVRSFGVAGLLHDIGKIRIPIEVLTKPGRLTPAERRLMNTHPVEGARIILDSEESLDLAAVVAYEHHIMINGGGYPTFRYERECHQASKLVHVCDVYDALRTRRPYRDAWPAEQVLAYLEGRAGQEFDSDLVTSFARMMRQWEPRVAVLSDEHASVPVAAAPEPAVAGVGAAAATVPVAPAVSAPAAAAAPTAPGAPAAPAGDIQPASG
jgi:putative nucleotidyltransferase with HDIG domain